MNLNLERYQRQLALPEISVAQQQALAGAHIAFIGAGGLGAAALPYLAGAGVGRITIIDHDSISLPNLHRQTIYKTAEAGRNKAEAMAEYLRALNPDVEIHPAPVRAQDLATWGNFTLLIDGSDNFETKSFLNDLSIQRRIPLISASVNQWAGQCGIFAGFAADGPCYHCLFPELPLEARTCNEAGILGTSAGLAGLYQAHLALLCLLGLERAGTVLTMDFKSLRLQKLLLEKNPGCPACREGRAAPQPQQKEPRPMTEMLSITELAARDHLIVDVRTAPELAADPIPGALHIELTTLPARHEELPKDRLLAFVCAGNVRSAQAAQYLAALGYTNVCVLDKFSL
jgi:molybdopterin/thiamine biosynthesis adenylyltransferase/rhodanese-related sulfurtransferase